MKSSTKQKQGSRFLLYLLPLLFALPLAAGILLLSGKYAPKAVEMVALAVKMGVTP